MSKMFDLVLRHCETIKAAGVVSESDTFTAAVCADGKLHSTICRDRTDITASQRVKFYDLLQDPEKYLHEDCFDSFIKLGSGIAFKGSGSHRNVTLSVLINEAVELSRSIDRSKIGAGGTFQENLNILIALEDFKHKPGYFGLEIYETNGFPKTQPQAATIRNKIVKHLMKNQREETITFLEGYKTKGSSVPNGISAEAFESAQKVGKDQELRALMEEIEKLNRESGRTFITTPSNLNWHNGRRGVGTPYETPTWVKNKDYYLRMLLEHLFAGSDKDTKAKFWQIPHSLMDISRELEILDNVKMIEVDSPLTETEMKTFTMLMEGKSSSSVTGRNYYRSSSYSTFDLESAYKSVVALR